MIEAFAPRIYNLFPLLVGPVSAWREHLPRVSTMGFDWIYLNPFQYPGFSGSLYAIKDPYRLHPSFVEAHGTGMGESLSGFTEEAGHRGLGVMMDLVINHTSKDSVVAMDHPDWFLREEDGSLRSPRALDVDEPDNLEKATVWGDLAEIDYSPRAERKALVQYWMDLVRYYVGLGFRGFRCDAAYKVPADVWAEVIAAGRSTGRPLLFAAETLGCRFEEVEALRAAGFDCLFNSSKWWDFEAPWLIEQYETFRRIAPSISFPESHDTPRLISEVPNGVSVEAAYRQRYLFATVFSSGIMMPIGFEFGFSKALDVVATRPEDWETPSFDLSEFIGKANRMKAAVPVLNGEGPQSIIDFEGGNAIGMLRREQPGDSWCLSIVNKDLNTARTVWADELEGLDFSQAVEVTPGHPPQRQAGDATVVLGPAEVRIFAKT